MAHPRKKKRKQPHTHTHTHNGANVNRKVNGFTPAPTKSPRKANSRCKAHPGKSPQSAGHWKAALPPKTPRGVEAEATPKQLQTLELKSGRKEKQRPQAFHATINFENLRFENLTLVLCVSIVNMLGKMQGALVSQSRLPYCEGDFRGNSQRGKASGLALIFKGPVSCQKPRGPHFGLLKPFCC